MANNPFSSRNTFHDPRDDYDPWDEPITPTRRRFNLDGYQTVRYRGADWLRGASEAARWIGCGRTTVYDRVKRGTVRSVKVREPSGNIVRLFSPGSLRLSQREAEKRKREQRSVAGPGRGRRDRTEGELAAARERAEVRWAERRAQRSGLSILD